MGLTSASMGTGVLSDALHIERTSPTDRVVALAGNPNVGKSTVFNALTGLHQHTGNWPGKTVSNAQGSYAYKGGRYILVDIPGTYSLMASSVEEEVARDFICFGGADCTLVIVDATCVERNLNLVLQVCEITSRVVVCVNLLDEAEKKRIHVDLDALSKRLCVPVVGCAARSGKGLDALMAAVAAQCACACGEARAIAYDQDVEAALSLLTPHLPSAPLSPRFTALKLLEGDAKLTASIREAIGERLDSPALQEALERARQALAARQITPDRLRDRIVAAIVHHAEDIYAASVRLENPQYNRRDRRLDRLLTSKATGIPVMLLLLALIFYLTIVGANYPSQLLSTALFAVQDWLHVVMASAPAWLTSLLVDGMYRTLAWVVSVMLPPMAIFFPLFTLLEDAGYLPRIAFNLDKCFRCAHAHGKQALTMCMGFGCNACGVIGCRIIDSPRERLIAILTNNFVPCNGRFPTLITLITLFFAVGSGALKSVTATLTLLLVILLGVGVTLLISRLLSGTVLKGLPSSFALELPPYRKPQVGQVIVRSVFDRTLFVLGRAVAVAAPAGLILWALANIQAGGMSLLAHVTQFLDPFARVFGLDGVILTAFILGLPANEIVIPIMLMAYLSTGSLTEMSSVSALYQLLTANGWTWVTALCTMLFSLMHFPCGTTLWTIHKETKSIGWTALAFVLPTVTGLIACFLVASLGRLLGVL